MYGDAQVLESVVNTMMYIIQNMIDRRQRSYLFNKCNLIWLIVICHLAHHWNFLVRQIRFWSIKENKKQEACNYMAVNIEKENYRIQWRRLFKCFDGVAKPWLRWGKYLVRPSRSNPEHGIRMVRVIYRADLLLFTHYWCED